jgi:PiT family inorganic phosphate transporter
MEALSHAPLMILVTVAVALIFDVINGFHDAANSITTVVTTRVLSPRVAVMWSAFFNFLAIFIFAPRVANTIAKIIDINPADPVFVYVVFSGLVGAVVWDLITWWWGIPSSSSHALIGGLTGAGLTYMGPSVINWHKLYTTVAFIPLAPIMGMSVAVTLVIGVYWLLRRQTPQSVDRVARKVQLFSASLNSIGHGGNDAQKTMGVILALMIAAGIYKPDVELSMTHSDTAWIVWSCNIAMAIGTAMGGWKIVKTLGTKLSKLKPIQGVCSETSGALTLFLATHFGISVSTTHTVADSILKLDFQLMLVV